MKFTRYHRAQWLSRRKPIGNLYLNGQLVGQVLSMKINFTATPDPTNFNAVFGKFGTNSEQEQQS